MCVWFGCCKGERRCNPIYMCVHFPNARKNRAGNFFSLRLRSKKKKAFSCTPSFLPRNPFNNPGFVCCGAEENINSFLVPLIRGRENFDCLSNCQFSTDEEGKTTKKKNSFVSRAFLFWGEAIGVALVVLLYPHSMLLIPRIMRLFGRREGKEKDTLLFILSVRS